MILFLPAAIVTFIVCMNNDISFWDSLRWAFKVPVLSGFLGGLLWILLKYTFVIILPKADVERKAQAERTRISPLEFQVQQTARSEGNALEKEIAQLTEWLQECKRQEHL